MISDERLNEIERDGWSGTTNDELKELVAEVKAARTRKMSIVTCRECGARDGHYTVCPLFRSSADAPPDMVAKIKAEERQAIEAPEYGKKLAAEVAAETLVCGGGCPWHSRGTCALPPGHDGPCNCSNCRLRAMQPAPSEAVDHPKHYNSLGAKCSACGHPIECIDVVRHMSFNLGNATKYAWRAGLKGSALEDVRKARWYLDDEIKQLEAKGK